MLADLGFSVTDYIQVCILMMGFVASSAIGGYVAFLVIKKGLRWISIGICPSDSEMQAEIDRINYYESHLDADGNFHDKYDERFEEILKNL